MDPIRMSQTSSMVTARPRNSSGMMVSVAAAALPMPSARWPAARPMLEARARARGGGGSRGRVGEGGAPGGGAGLLPNGGRGADGRFVVDGLGPVGAADGAARPQVDLAAGEGRVVAAD